MDVLYSILKFFHVMSFVFMSIPLFNLIVVNERALLGPSFNYHADRYMENIIKHGAYRCFVFQSAALMTGVLLLIFGPLGIKALWTNWIILVKTVLLFSLMGLLSYVHFFVQPKIEAILASLRPDSPAPEAPINELKPYRAKRKKLATFCLFLVVTTIILGLQVYDTFNPFLNICLIALAGIFALRANKTLIRFGWF
ncbi:MAG: hypothetical protein A2879_05310 [Omnitrophica WOR_2 bacterium RIFCSPHIGHO2_01_FULL_49_10]|nr:MAG: hypothetical protein A2879_05310 [Omnitrophica WOR_2 bacterium RIFCSPHIGHO2_01_FULL_49_10]OGX33226.1 MAG: hypothetical protein A3I43_06455 [Omnitrophica WOR_2 bacterium RIFCSPLOWO2_02_FULL_50_19]